jgi:ankyrin repeat protein
MQNPDIQSILGIKDKTYIVDYEQLSTYLDTHHPDDIITQMFPFQTNILYYAIHKSNLKLIQLLLKRGANINSPKYTTHSGMTLLIYALYFYRTEITDDRIEIINEILKYKPDLDKFDNYGDTALMVACWRNEYEDIALYLIDHGANINQDTKDCVIRVEHNNTALTAICEHGTKNYSVQKKLIELGAHKHLIARTGASYELYLVCQYNKSTYNPYLTRELVNAGANVYHNNTPDTIICILQCPELSDIWKTVINKIKPSDALPIFKCAMSLNNKFVDKYVAIDESKTFDNDFIAAAAANNCTKPIKRYLFNLLFGQFNRKKLNKYITYTIIDFTA